MKQEEVRALIRNSHQKPVRVCLTDGKSYTIAHPDYGAVAENALIVLNGPGHDLGNVSFAICYFDEITRLQQLNGNAQTA